MTCTNAQYSIHSVSSYTTAFYHTASYVVGITDDEMLDRFVAGSEAKIREKVLLSKADTFEKAYIAAERVGVVFIDMDQQQFKPFTAITTPRKGIYQGKRYRACPYRGHQHSPVGLCTPKTNETNKILLEKFRFCGKSGHK